MCVCVGGADDFGLHEQQVCLLLAQVELHLFATCRAWFQTGHGLVPGHGPGVEDLCITELTTKGATTKTSTI